MAVVMVVEGVQPVLWQVAVHLRVMVGLVVHRVVESRQETLTLMEEEVGHGLWKLLAPLLQVAG